MNTQPSNKAPERYVCNTCNGAGEYNTDVGVIECGHCGGSGYLFYDSETKTLTSNNKVHEGHTPGPWKVRFFREDEPEAGFFVEAKHTHPDAAYGIDILCEGDAFYPWQQRLADAKLIASAPTLLDERAQLRAEVETLRIEGSKFAYEADRAKRDRDIAERESWSRSEEIERLGKQLVNERYERGLELRRQEHRIKELEAVVNAFIKTIQISLPNVAAPLRETFELAIAKAKDKLRQP